MATLGASAAASSPPSSPPAPSPSSSPAEIKLHPPIVEEPQWPPTEEEIKFAPQVAKFRAANAAFFEENKGEQCVDECVKIDRACIRFLLARNMDEAKASQMLRECTAYRKKNRTDQILDPPFPLAHKIKEKYYHCYHHADKLGRPVYFEQTGRLDIPFLSTNWTPEEMLHYHTHNTEYFRRVLLPAASVRAGKRIDQVVSIIDLNGLGRHHLTKAAYNFLSNVSKVDQLIYPEVLGKMVIINAGLIFKTAWVVIRPWLEERTKSKIDIIRGDGREELLKLIDEEHLPIVFGGKCTCYHPTPVPPGSPPPPGSCIEASPEVRNWKVLAETGLEAQLKARAGATSSSPSSSSASSSPPPTSPSPASPPAESSPASSPPSSSAPSTTPAPSAPSGPSS